MSLERTLFIALATVACSPTPADRLNYESSWEIFAGLDDGAILHVGLSTGNRGLRRGEGEIQWAYLPPQGAGFTFHERHPPELVDAAESTEAWTFGQTRWERVEDGLRLSIRTRGALEGRFIVQGFAPPTEPTTFESGSLERVIKLSHPHASISGAWTAGGAGEIVEGRAVALRATGAADNTRRADDITIHLMASDASLTVMQDEHGLAGWLTEGGLTQTLDDLRIERDGTDTTLSSERHALSARVKPREHSVQTTEFASAVGLERWIAERLSGPLSRQMWSGQTQLRLGQRTLPARVIVLDGYGKPMKSGLGPTR